MVKCLSNRKTPHQARNINARGSYSISREINKQSQASTGAGVAAPWRHLKRAYGMARQYQEDAVKTP